MSKNERRIRFPIRWKFLVLFVALAVVPLVVGSIFVMRANTSELRRLNETLLESVSDDAKRILDAQLEAFYSELVQVAQILSDSSSSVEQRLDLARAKISGARWASAVAFYDEMGQQVDIFRREGTTWSFSQEVTPAQRQSALEKNVLIEDPVLLGEDSVAFTLVPFEIAIDEKREQWFAGAFFPMEVFQESVLTLSNDERVNYPYGIFLIDANMRALAHPNLELSHHLSSVAAEGILDGFKMNSFEMGIQAMSPGKGLDGTPTFGSIRTLDRAPWAVVAQLPTERVYLPVEQLKRLVIGLSLAGVMLAAVMAWWLARRFSTPIDALVERAKRIGQRDFSIDPLPNRNDELGVLGNTLSLAAKQLRDSEEAIAHEQRIRESLGRFLPSQVVESVVQDASVIDLGGKKTQVTVLFADVASFTSLTEAMGGQAVSQVLNELFTVLTEIVFRHGGVVDKFIGDCVMAFWGAPKEDSKQGENALRAAAEMLHWLETVNEHWQTTYGVTVHLAIGVNSGEAVVGNFGSKARMEYTAIGDAVNVAARLEQVAQPQQILLTQATVNLCPQFEFIALGKRRLTGRLEEVELYEWLPFTS